MSKRAFDRIKAGLDDAISIARGQADPTTYHVHVPDVVDVRAVRRSTGLSQHSFALRYGFTAGAVRD